MTKLDEINILSPKYDANGLIAAIAQDYQTKEILMMAWMNEDALTKSIKTGQAHYWSRSRNELWHKGASSGAVQMIKDIRIDCDQDAVLMMVEQLGEGACHTNRPSCFYRRISRKNPTLGLEFLDSFQKID